MAYLTVLAGCLNYQNRIVLSSLTESTYTQRAASFKRVEGVNFNPGDGVETSQVLNLGEGFEPDYLLITDAVYYVQQRWYVMESSRNLSGQYSLRLRRDVLADFYPEIGRSYLKIERGWCPAASTLIFNPEGNSFSQLKTGEIPIKDYTQSRWYVGYLAGNAFEGGNISITIDDSEKREYDESYTSIAEAISNYPGSAIDATGSSNMLQEYDIRQLKVPLYDVIPTIDPPVLTSRRTYSVNVGAYYSTSEVGNGARPAYQIIPSVIESNAFEILNGTLSSSFHADDVKKSLLQDMLRDTGTTSEQYSTTVKSGGKVIRVGSDPYEFYQLNVYEVSETSKESDMTKEGEGYKYINGVLDGVPYVRKNQYGAASTFTYSFTYNARMVKAVWKLISKPGTISISNQVVKAGDAPYYVFAIPRDVLNVQYPDTTGTLVDTSLADDLVYSMIRQLGEKIYDVQALPYFPGGHDLELETGGLFLPNTDYYTDVRVGDKHTIICWLPSISCDKGAITGGIHAWDDIKLDNETRFVRLASPNYASLYDFSVAKNGGVTGWAITMTVRPYQPYIHVAPIWGGLYSPMYQYDPKGLILGGNYSVDIVSSAWTSYEIANKNYQLIFDRNVQTLDLQQSIERNRDIRDMVSGFVNAGMATAGSYVSGGAKGAVISAAKSAGGLISSALSMQEAEQLRQNARDSMMDMQSYNLGNIRARPDTLTKVSSINKQNKGWPVAEIYTAPQNEVDAYIALRKYAGMTVGVIGRLNEYLRENPYKYRYIRAQVLRLNAEVDTHMAQVINAELSGGCYFYNEGGEE